jgi:hypothetical protein
MSNETAEDVAKKLADALGFMEKRVELSSEILRGVTIFTAATYSTYIDAYKDKGALAVLRAHKALAQAVADDVKTHNIQGLSIEVGEAKVESENDDNLA